MACPEIPLLTLADGHAPYKGTWCLVQQGITIRPAEAGDCANVVEAIHTTYNPEHSPGCVIERLRFAGEDLARDFVRHLLVHNWRVRAVHRAGESFWIGLPT
jgi:hypothetical protein